MVYIIVNEKELICKIGFSKDPSARLINLQTGCPYPLKLERIIDGDINKERELHKVFDKFRLEGEWFIYNEEIREFFGIPLSNPVIMYINQINKLYTLSHAEYRLLSTLAMYIEYNTNEFYLNLKRKEELITMTGLKFNTISQCLTRLVKKNLLLRVSNSTYQMNPLVFFKGEDMQRSKYLEITTRYEICPECGEREKKTTKKEQEEFENDQK